MKLNLEKLSGTIFIFVIVMAIAGFFPGSTDAADTTEKAKAQILVDQAVITVEEFMEDPSMEWLQNNLKDAKGLLIVPGLLKAGFVWGGSGGNGILVVC